jgi:hypothetical protein
MKKLILLFVFLILTSPINSQWIIESFDSSAGLFFREPVPRLTHYLLFFNDTSHYEGVGSLSVDYSVEAFNGWGGGIVSSTYSLSDTSLPYYDLSDGDFLSFWYKVLQPINMATTGQFFMEFKLAEIDNSGLRDLWLHHTALDFSDSSGQWIQLKMPLVQRLNNTQRFVLHFGDGDGWLQLENIRGFEMALVYSTNGGNPPPRAHGSFLMDRLELLYPSSVGEETNSPTVFVLEQNYPNPFNPSTRIQYSIQSVVSNKEMITDLKVYDMLGNEVATLVDKTQSAGTYEVEFNNTQLSSGIYYYQLRSGSYAETKKMVLLK